MSASIQFIHTLHLLRLRAMMAASSPFPVASIPFALVTLLLLLFLQEGLASGSSGCTSDSLVLYQVQVKYHWSRTNFPRHFPGFGYRPSAQWSRLVGRSHNSSYTLFRIGEMASTGLKRFAETSSTEGLDELPSYGVFDAFAGPAIPGGEGHTQSQVFLDGNHSQVSMMARIVPSPDWFCGVDGVDLCVNSEWIDSLTLELDPIDAGTDNGYTFSAPNWATLPPEAIYNIYSAKLHPAHSLYKVERQPFATLSIVKLKEYSLAALRGGPEGHLDPIHQHLFDEIEHEMNEIAAPEEGGSSRKRKRSRRQRHGGQGGGGGIRAAPGAHHGRDCAVSEWSEWSECTTQCGVGEQRRNRYITNHPRPGGSSCPPLQEKRACNSARECRDNYFDW